MEYKIDNDLHIHSKLSLCSNDPEQTNERILQYALDNGLKTVCVTDHFWDENIPVASEWYRDQNYEHVSKAKPLPQVDGVRFLFGCETELDRFLTLGIQKEKFDLFDFIIIPTTHFHMEGFTLSEEEYADNESRAKAWIKRLDTVLSMDLPFYKVGLAHLTCGLNAREKADYLKVLNLIPDEELVRLFTKASKLGVGIELNSSDMGFKDDEADTVLRIYKTAKECGCKFYFGSDAHHPKTFDIAKERFEKAVKILNLTENERFIF